MKFRPLDSDIKLNPETIKVPENPYSKSYKVKVITPIYGGGVVAGELDKEMPVRASAIRGQLRYWWRFLAKNREQNPLTGEALFAAEREIWGGIGDEKELKESGQKDYSSKVFIKVEAKPISEQQLTNAKETIGSKIGIGYALFSAFQGDENHKLIKAGYTFKLEIFSHDLRDEDCQTVLLSIRWWASFGGIGARTRRGLGSIEILNQNFEPISESEIKKYNCSINKICAVGSIDAWNKAIGKLQRFRQGVGVGRNQKKDDQGKLVFFGKNNNIPAQGGSRWPEPDSIREITKSSSPKHKPNENESARLAFPRAAFGLPIVFKFNDSDERQGDPIQTELCPVDSERMASPLILKAMAIGNDEYVAIALLLPTNHQDDLTLKLKGLPNKPSGLSREKEQEWDEKKWEQWPNPENWWNKSKAINVKPINNYNANDPLTAFMNFFVSKTEENND